MKIVRNSVVGLAAVTTAAASLLLSTGTASADVPCDAPNGKYCIAIHADDNDQLSTSKSVRVNGRCLLGPFYQNTNTYYRDTADTPIDVTKRVDVEFYTQDTKCGAGGSVLGYSIYPLGQGANTWNGVAGEIQGRWAVIYRP